MRPFGGSSVGVGKQLLPVTFAAHRLHWKSSETHGPLELRSSAIPALSAYAYQKAPPLVLAWYDDALSAPLASITSPATGANVARRMWLDPRLVPRLQGRRVLVVDNVISTGSSAQAGLALLRTAGVVPVGFAVAMIQGEAWRAAWPDLPVAAAFSTPLFRRVDGGWVAI